MRKAIAGMILALFACIQIIAQQIIPLPQSVSLSEGNFLLSSTTTIASSPEMFKEAAFLQQKIKTWFGYTLPVSKSTGTHKGKIIFLKESAGNIKGAYRLDVTPSAIVIRADDATGAFYGAVSLLQLMEVPVINEKPTQPLRVPAASISDAPRFEWRGLMLDVSRTFMPPSYVKKMIERMAFYKLNVLHLHLTDDQGWRIPIKSYPLLNEKAASFDASYHEPKEFQGYYSEKDIKDLVTYAQSMHIQVIPEIETPGHSRAPLLAYPSLSCNGIGNPIFPYFHGPGVTEDIFCVGNPGSLKFFESVISETAELFPAPYMHLGGDEVPRGPWKKCEKCKKLVISKKMHSANELQGYFMDQLHTAVLAKGKRPIAWDEILEENPFLTKNWIVMSWRGSKPGLEAASHGYDVVMAPTTHLYFDYSYETTNTKKVFEFDPFEGATSDSVTKRILGIQANFWSHIDRTQSKIDYQLFPRLLALAERAWSPADNKDYPGFRKRKIYHKQWLDIMQVKYYAQDF